MGDVVGDAVGLVGEAVGEVGDAVGLVGDTVGNGAGSVLGVFAAVVTETFGATLLAAMVYRERTDGPSAMAFMLFIISFNFS